MELINEWTDPTKPLYAELAPLIATGSDIEVAEILNRQDRTGYIPRRHVAVTLARFPVVLGLMHWVVDSRTMPTAFGGGPVDFGLYCLFTTIWFVTNNDEDIKASIPELSAGLAQLPIGLIPDAFIAELLSGEIKISRAEEILGREVNAQEIGIIRNGGE